MTITKPPRDDVRHVRRTTSVRWAVLVVTIAAVLAVLATDPAADAIASQLNGLPSISTWSNLVVPLVLTGATWAQIRTLVVAASTSLAGRFPASRVLVMHVVKEEGGAS